MENTDHISTDLPAAVPAADTLDAVRRNHAQRLLDMAEAMLQAFEAMDIPKDHTGLDRMGKALLTLNKVMDTLHSQARTLTHRAKVEAAQYEADGELAPDPAQALEMVQIYRAAQSLRLEAMVLKRAEAGRVDGVTGKPPRHQWP